MIIEPGLYYLGGVPPDQVDAEDFARPGEGDGPPVVAVGELLGRHVPVQVPRHGPGHDEGEDVRVGPVRKPDESGEQSHGRRSGAAVSSILSR